MHPEPDQAFMEQLKAIRPRRLQAATIERIEAAIHLDRRRLFLRRFRAVSLWTGAAAAAVMALVAGGLLVSGRIDLPQLADPLDSSMGTETAGMATSESAGRLPAGESALRPILAENSLQGRIDEGIVFLDNGITAKRYRYAFIDRIVWKNTTDGSLVEMSIPRDEFVLVPVQTF